MTHEFSCSACSFQVQSDDDQEVIDLVKTHAADHHDMDMSDSDVRDGWSEIHSADD